MSRHVHMHKDAKGKEWEVACGYDRPLMEYFLQVFDPSAMSNGDYESPEGCDENGCFFSIGSHSTMKCHPEYQGKFHWSNGEILEQMKAWGCKQEHRHQVALDLPF